MQRIIKGKVGEIRTQIFLVPQSAKRILKVSRNTDSKDHLKKLIKLAPCNSVKLKKYRSERSGDRFWVHIHKIAQRYKSKRHAYSFLVDKLKGRITAAI